MIRLFYLLPFFIFIHVSAQQGNIHGVVSNQDGSIPFSTIEVGDLKITTGIDGEYSMSLDSGLYKITASAFGYRSETKKILLKPYEIKRVNFQLAESINQLDEVVITGTMKPVSKSESSVPVEIYTPEFFKKNPTPNIFEALQNVNGVRPQLNCSVCNTGDIHINGLEGPYTMVLIDGMPIVSSLSTVYGLSGIPNSLIQRIEIVKGPASSLYGSEAVGGLINIITKTPEDAPIVSADVFTTSWLEHNIDLGFKNTVGENASFLTGVNYYNYDHKVDYNHDNFTDVTLQNRISIFEKFTLKRTQNRQFSLAARYFTEDRWGGEMNWTPEFRGGDSIYGENIITNRWEIIGKYDLPIKEKVSAQFSLNSHDQNSAYGTTYYLANQKINFGQLVWDKRVKKHDLLTGVALRHTYYDDNTPATANLDSSNHPNKTLLPGVFIQDEINFTSKQKLLLGARYDYNSNHGNIFTPRVGYKYAFNKKNIVRINSGTGFRVVNLFTEDHAALTGARKVIIEEELNPEQSYNVNLNYEKKIFPSEEVFIGLDFSAWYTYFTNQIIPDYATNPDQIIYKNLDGYAQSRGISLNTDMIIGERLKILAGGTVMDVSFVEEGKKERPFLTENWTSVWAFTYSFPKLNLAVDYTGNIYGSMRLPLASELDPRRATSPVWSIQNIQFSYQKKRSPLKVFGGVKNLLNWTPNKNNPFIIARSNDPFDKNVEYDGTGQIISTPNNPYGLSFDPTYVYAPNQGLRLFLGLNVRLNQ